MKFYWYDSGKYFKKGMAAILPEGMEFPSCLLIKDTWDDMGWTTTFRFRFYENKDSYKVDELLNILKEDQRATTLPDSPFERLPANYYMIGANFEFYTGLRSLEEPVWKEILLSLRDVVFNEIPVDLKTLAGFQTSLLRSSEVEKFFNEPELLFKGLQRRHAKVLSFQYSKLLPGADDPHVIDFDFSSSESGLNRINALIGRNGTGKTQILADFANAMSGLKQYEVGSFSPSRPSFSRVIAISYSAFDNFSRPTSENASFGYKYCGIWDAGEGQSLLSPAGIFAKFSEALTEVVSSQQATNCGKF